MTAVPDQTLEEVTRESTQRWNDVPRGTMDEVSSHVRLDLPFFNGKAA